MLRNSQSLKKQGLQLIAVGLIFLLGNAGLAQDLPRNLAGQESAKLSLAITSGLDRAAMEEFLVRARVVQKRELSTGVTNSQRATLDDGQQKHDAHIQTVDISKNSFQTLRGTELAFRDSYKFNMAAYELDKLLDLNMVPVSVERRVGGQQAAVTWWVDDAMMTELDRHKKKVQSPDLPSWNKQMYVCRVFDQLIYNTDRNLGNLVITKDWNIWMIDHTRAFRRMKDLQTPQNLVQCDRKLLAKMRELNSEVLKQKLGRYLSDVEIDAILSRRDKIVRLFDDKIAQTGEAQVLFDLDRSQY